ncbi:MAG: hypothetical protein RJA57_662 [Bacteroidota bacterium]
MTWLAPHYRKANKNALLAFLRRDRYFVRTPDWLKRLFPGCIWDLPRGEKTLYLTFDDGPHPIVTPFVLDLLKRHGARATFFCIGSNVERNPELYRRILDEGHATGNHTHHHLNGWKTLDADYVADIQKAAAVIHSPLFRPPYGRLRRSQIRAMQAAFPEQRIIMWNILSGDWDPLLPPAICYSRIRKRIQDGDLIVFHDSEKAAERMMYALPKLLEEFGGKGYRFCPVSLNPD